MESVTIIRHDHGDHGEYVAHVSDSENVGRLTWVQRDSVRAAEHTLVPKDIGGRGVAAELVKALIEDARAQGFKVRPDCSYVAAMFDRHPDWIGLRA